MNRNLYDKVVCSSDYKMISSPLYYGSVIYMICLSGNGLFVYNGTPFRFTRNDIVVITDPCRVKDIKEDDLNVRYIVVPEAMLQGLLPQNNYSIVDIVNLLDNPVISVSEEDASIFLSDINRVVERVNDTANHFYSEIIGSLLLTVMYDIFNFHSKEIGGKSLSGNRGNYIVKMFMMLIRSEHIKRYRDVGYYADKLNVTPKYLSDTVRRATGHGALYHINQSTTVVVKELLNRSDMDITQIVEDMNFESMSYFSRFCSKHIGMPPGRYRKIKR